MIDFTHDFLLSDHCAKKLLPWFDGMLEANEEYFKWDCDRLMLIALTEWWSWSPFFETEVPLLGCFQQGQWGTPVLIAHAWPERGVWRREHRNLCQIFQGIPLRSLWLTMALPCTVCSRRTLRRRPLHLVEILHLLLFRRRRERKRRKKGVKWEMVNERRERKQWFCTFHIHPIFLIQAMFSGWRRWSCGWRWRSGSLEGRRWVSCSGIVYRRVTLGKCCILHCSCTVVGLACSREELSWPCVLMGRYNPFERNIFQNLRKCGVQAFLLFCRLIAVVFHF